MGLIADDVDPAEQEHTLDETETLPATDMARGHSGRRYNR